MPEALRWPVAPLLIAGAYLAMAAVTLVVRNLVADPFRDEETTARGASAILPMALRQFFIWSLEPLWRLVRWSGIPAHAVTTAAALWGIGSGVAAAGGDLALAGWLYLGAGLFDVLDGRVARHAGTAGPRGAIIDSVLDRYADAAVLCGLAWHLRGHWALVLALGALVGSLLVSYVRARGEGLGVDVRVGVMQRAERVILLGSTLALAPVVELWSRAVVPAQALVIATLGFLAVTTQVTALRRLAHVVRAFSPKGQEPRKTFERLVPATVSAFVATAADFGLVMLLVSHAGVSAARATAVGCLLGGVINFSMNRWWTFGSTARPSLQAARYTIVSVSSALLNSGGVALALTLPLVDYRVGWVVVRALVFLCWNFPLQRDYVYGPQGENQPELEPDDGAKAIARPRAAG